MNHKAIKIEPLSTGQAHHWVCSCGRSGVVAGNVVEAVAGWSRHLPTELLNGLIDRLIECLTLPAPRPNPTPSQATQRRGWFGRLRHWADGED